MKRFSSGDNRQLFAECEIDHTVLCLTSIKRLCSAAAAAVCCAVKTHRTLLNVWALAFPFPPFIRKRIARLAPFNLELLLCRDVSPLRSFWSLKSIEASFTVWGWISSFGNLIDFYLDFIKHLDKPIKEAADCSQQHLIHHSVRGIKSDWH